MADCTTTLGIEFIRAKITMGPYYYVTPGTDDDASGEVMSFNINKARGTAVGTMSCQLTVWISSAGALEALHTAEDNMGEKVIVQAGALEPGGSSNLDDLPTLFTGYIISVRESPHWNDARKYLLDIQAEDVFAKMKYGPRYTRRFKLGDDAFAVITGGQHRKGGQMTTLKKRPGGKKGISWIDTSSSTPGAMDHSPLIKTPDAEHKRPRGSNPANLKGANNSTSSDQYSYRCQPSHVFADQGSQVSVVIIDNSTGEALDLQSMNQLAGTGCILHCDPAPRDLSGSSWYGTGMKMGSNTWPLSVRLGTSTDSTANVFEFTVVAEHPVKVTFVHPENGGNATLEFDVVPPHSHDRITQGGPAKGAYDVSQY
jgi:hypothetical protein